MTTKGNYEFTARLISTASIAYFHDNNLAFFETFLKDQIALDRDWRVAPYDIIFPTKLNNVNGQEFMYFRASYVLAGKSNAGNRKTILRPYYGKKFLSNRESTLL